MMKEWVGQAGKGRKKTSQLGREEERDIGLITKADSLVLDKASGLRLPALSSYHVSLYCSLPAHSPPFHVFFFSLRTCIPSLLLWQQRRLWFPSPSLTFHSYSAFLNGGETLRIICLCLISETYFSFLPLCYILLLISSLCHSVISCFLFRVHYVLISTGNSLAVVCELFPTRNSFLCSF